MNEYNRCTKCVMDISTKEIVFDDNGVCNFCHNAQKMLNEIKDDTFPTIGQDGGQKYDCLIGLSGGVDSSYALHLAVKRGLHPLCFSIDNGWNDPRADENIMRLVETLKVPFYRYTINLTSFRALQGAFMRAGVKNIEIPTDHILLASSLEMASKYGIKTIISGGNVATESIMPSDWGHNARDLTHIQDISKKMTGKKVHDLPTCSIWKWNYYKWWKGIKTVYLLDYVDYNREEAIKTLEKEYGYQPYGEKHCENTFTHWFQNYYLFTKFGIDKRKAHLSSLINSGQMTRPEALAILDSAPVYPELGIEDKAMRYPKHEHSEYKMDKWYDRIAKILRK